MDPIEVRCPLPKRPGVSNRCGIKFAVEQFRAREDDPENEPVPQEEAKPAGEAE